MEISSWTEKAADVAVEEDGNKQLDRKSGRCSCGGGWK